MGPMILSIDGREPTVGADAWVAPTATLIGDVHLGDRSSVWFGTVLRAEAAPISIGHRSNVQDGCVFHTDASFPLELGSGVSVGHRAVLHGCTVEDDVLIGMGAIVLNGARIGTGSLIAAGAVVREGAEIPPGSLVAGVPGKVRRELTDEELARVRRNAESYDRLRERYRTEHGG